MHRHKQSLEIPLPHSQKGANFCPINVHAFVASKHTLYIMDARINVVGMSTPRSHAALETRFGDMMNLELG